MHPKTIKTPKNRFRIFGVLKLTCALQNPFLMPRNDSICIFRPWKVVFAPQNEKNTTNCQFRVLRVLKSIFDSAESIFHARNRLGTIFWTLEMTRSTIFSHTLKMTKIDQNLWSPFTFFDFWVYQQYFLRKIPSGSENPTP